MEKNFFFLINFFLFVKVPIEMLITKYLITLNIKLRLSDST